jgi:hypothetical protein
MDNKQYMKIIVEFSNGYYYEIDGEELNPKQIELISHMLKTPEMKELVIEKV